MVAVSSVWVLQGSRRHWHADPVGDDLRLRWRHIQQQDCEFFTAIPCGHRVCTTQRFGYGRSHCAETSVSCMVPIVIIIPFKMIYIDEQKSHVLTSIRRA